MKKTFWIFIFLTVVSAIGAMCSLISCADGTFDTSQPELPDGYEFPDADMGKYLTSYSVAFRVDKLELADEMAYVRLSPKLINSFADIGYKIESVSYTIDGKEVTPVYSDGMAITTYGHYDEGTHTATARINVSYDGTVVRTLIQEEEFNIYGHAIQKKEIDFVLDVIENLEGSPLKARIYVNEQRSDPQYEIGSVNWMFHTEGSDTYDSYTTSTAPYTYTILSPGTPVQSSLSAWVYYGIKGSATYNKCYGNVYSDIMPNSKDAKWNVSFKLLTNYHVYKRNEDIIGIARIYSSAENQILSIEIDGNEVLSTSKFPYEFHIPASELSLGLHTIQGRFIRSDISSNEGNTLIHMENPFVVVE